ncbi:hypothetical protein BP5796_03353 [Coleophoma crateriformis]|uniref:DUF202 domain-containing protein n=1 Tax=Coleophoma crateriformis TaxID=565419 RepID=A0A3D8SMT7_9HELO|nr:hypothetical protein BP5796_03353 [Coleophoma crateriformis]
MTGPDDIATETSVDATADVRPPRSQAVAQEESIQLEATELAQVKSNYERASSNRLPSTGNVATPKRPTNPVALLLYNVKNFWRHQVSVTVPHEACRDHLALERTFLGYLRTSLALSMIGITVAQLFRLQHSPTPNPTFGYFVLGQPLACICQGAAIFTLSVGAFRTWRQQNAIIRGKAVAGGAEVVLIGFGVFAASPFSSMIRITGADPSSQILLMFFVLLVAVDITKEDENFSQMTFVNSMEHSYEV